MSRKSISFTWEPKEEDDGPCERRERSRSPTASLQTVCPKTSTVGCQSSMWNPDQKDFSRWHEHCRPFLLKTIQYRTEQDIQSFTSCRDKLEKHLIQQLADQHDREYGDLSFLELRPAIEVDIPIRQTPLPIRNAAIQSRIRGGRANPPFQDGDEIISQIGSPISSQISISSISSQVSDSVLNDVQQSAEALLQSIRLARAELRSLEGGDGVFDTIKRTFHPSKYANYDEVLALMDAILQLEDAIHSHRSDMVTIGFPDTGLQLNAYEQTFRENVLNHFETIKREKKIKTPRKISERPKAGKYYQRDYRNLTSTTIHMAGKTRQALQSAIKTRDDYLKAAYKNVNDATQIYAKSCDLQIQDQYDGRVLVSRVFQSSRLDDAVNAMLLEY